MLRSIKTTPPVKQVQTMAPKMSNWVGADFVDEIAQNQLFLFQSNMLKPLLSEVINSFMTIVAFISQNTHMCQSLFIYDKNGLDQFYFKLYFDRFG